MVFQSYALSPHMMVAEDMSVSLKIAGIGKADRQGRARRASDILQLTDYLNRRPNRFEAEADILRAVAQDGSQSAARFGAIGAAQPSILNKGTLAGHVRPRFGETMHRSVPEDVIYAFDAGGNALPPLATF
jgi:hypothetical protein